MERTERVAIVGIGGIFPRSPDLGRFWDNVAGGTDATGEVPPGRWRLDPKDVYDPRVGAVDHVYATRGGFIEDFQLDPEGLDVDRELLGRLDPMFHLALHAGRQAWRDAVTEGLDRCRVGVVLGNIVLPTESASALTRATLGRGFAEKLGVTVEGPVAWEPLNAYVAGLPAGLLARALGLGGGTFTLDAACASSLYALKLASDELLERRADAMIAGGLSRPDPLYTQMGFAQLRALASSGRPRPFDAQGDGLIVGEGAGMFVLKRLSDAEAHGDTIYGVIAGAGLSNDVDGGLLAPSSEGQLRAMRAAYERAGWDPRTVDLIECHATGTPVGDAVEFASLKALWGAAGWVPGRCAIGSVKSNIGHTLTAAGSAGLLKVLLALQHRVLPPTANFQTPAPGLGYESSPFRVLTESEPWESTPDRPRRAALSGFGFGGINAHVLIEEYVPEVPDLSSASVTYGLGAWSASGFAVEPSAPEDRPDGKTEGPGVVPIAIVGMAAHFGPFAGLRAFQERVLGGGAPAEPAGPRHWWGAPESAWWRREGLDRVSFRGNYLDELTLRPDEFRIPPKELEEMLPQQSLMLRVAADAIAHAGWDDHPRLRTGVFIGLGLDLNTTNFQLRWSMVDRAREWNQQLGLGLSDEELRAWVEELRAAAGPPLTANRTMGALGGLVASRIAREFRVGGPSFTISSEETSGTRALDVAIRLLRRGEIDEALVGAVDFAGDLRAVLSAHRLHPVSASGTARPFDPEADGGVPTDGAAALILKRLDDAERAGDTVHAIVRGIGAASGGGIDGLDSDAYQDALARAYSEAGVRPESVSYLEAHGSGRPEEDRIEAAALARFNRDRPAGDRCFLGGVKADIGHPGAASGLAAVVKTALCLHQQIVPPLRGVTGLRPELNAAFLAPRGPQFWLRDRTDGPRRAGVSSLGIDGNCLHVVLEGYEPSAAMTTVERRQPLGARSTAMFAIEADDLSDVLGQVDALEELAARLPGAPIEALARRWWQAHPGRPDRRLGLSLVADGIGVLRDRLRTARQVIGDGNSTTPRPGEGTGFSFSLALRQPKGVRVPLGPDAGLAFVFPGMGNLFAGMGRALSAQWPEVLRVQDTENRRLRSQMAPGTFWNDDPPEFFDDHRAPILGQIALGCLVSDLLLGFGLMPEAAIGYSLGESAALVALRAWAGRDEMHERLLRSPLFRTELAGPCNAARREWKVPEGEPVDWVAGIVPYPSGHVLEALSGRARVYLLMVNAPNETVVGGDRRAVQDLVRDLGGRFLALPVVSTVHCAIAGAVEDEYRALHLLPTTAPAGIRFYSGAWGRSYIAEEETAAAAIVAHAVHGFDFPNVIERAYADGVRIFIEAGPGGSCTRMIDAVLAERPHLARSACVAGAEAVGTVLDLLARLIAERVTVDLEPLYGRETRAVGHATEAPATAARTLRVVVGGGPFVVPPVPYKVRATPHRAAQETRVRPTPDIIPQPAPTSKGQARPAIFPRIPSLPRAADTLTLQLLAAESAKAEAHEAFLRASNDLAQTMANQLGFQMALIESLQGGAFSEIERLRATRPESAPDVPPPTVALDRAHCLEFAVGSIGQVLGDEFAPVDDHPTRVRLPDEPLMLVDRILTIEGRPRSLQGGRVVTEHDVLPDGWYLDCDRIAPSIAIESGQADLFLSAYLGIDFETKGLACYRLLDAAVTFHRGLPRPGEVIRYDIRIDHFFRQGDTYLFRFRFEGTVGGAPVLTMREGIAGFFTAEELAAGKGVVHTALDLRPLPGVRPDDWEDLAPRAVEGLGDHQVEALREGDLAAAFGPAFAGLPLRDPLRLPGGRMALLDRVTRIDPAGGRYGMGLIRAERDIHPDDWFLTCHFVDDRVMPGTLMYETCLHTLRIYMMRLGWVGERDEVAVEPVPGVAARLKCRGQVNETTRTATYEIAVKELGYRPEPYAIVDALMYADGKAVVEITGLSLQFTGLTRERLGEIWAGRSEKGEDSLPSPSEEGKKPADHQPHGGESGTTAPLFDRRHILAFATGKPSEAFGEPYRVFDEGRFIARLPAPPYSFLDRITAVRAEPWMMEAGGEIEAQYDVPPDAWYFAADNQRRMPFSVLLEVALQPCGWFAAYMGSALTADEPLHFRNLGGKAVVRSVVTPATGTLTVMVKVTKVARSAGMIIQHYDFEVRAGRETVYRGDTYFGYFRAEALADQVGVREANPYRPGPTEKARARDFPYPTVPPLPGEGLCMIDWVDTFIPHGGPKRLGFIEGSKAVDPGDWFFQAHFFQDPVCPGSLGVESLLQLLKVVAVERWGSGPELAFESTGIGDTHRWIYRGQVVPKNQRVLTQAVITESDDRRRWLKADGFLSVDGRVIYQMNDFTIRCASETE